MAALKAKGKYSDNLRFPMTQRKPKPLMSYSNGNTL